MFRTTLSNGLRVIILTNPAVDIVSARFFLSTAPRRQVRPGLGHLVSAVLTKGTELRSSLAIAHAVESLGAALGADSHPDYLQLSLKSLSEDFENLFILAAELLQQATFPEEQIELERRVTLQTIRSQQERPFTVAYNQFRTALYGEEHPYAYSELGTEASVRAIDRSELVDFYRGCFRPDNAVFVAVGPLDPEATLALVEKHLGRWQPPDESLAPLVPQPFPQDAAIEAIRTPQATQQSMVVVGYGAASIHSPHFAALKLMSTYLGSGLSSRLFTELREKRGLAYEVSAFYPTRVDASHFVAYIGTAPENTRFCETGLREEVERLASVGLAPDELENTRNKLLGQYALGKQTNSQVAQLVGWYEIIGVGADFDRTYLDTVQALDADALRAVAEATFARPVISLVGPQEALAVSS